MKKSVAALGVALIATLGAASAAQAAVNVIDFGAASTGVVAYSGSSLDVSTALDLSAATIAVTTVGSDDTTGIALGTPITLLPLDIVYGSGDGPEAIDLSKTWTVGGTTYSETLSDVTITRSPANSITLSFTGEVTGGAFVDTPATLILNANQARGPGVGHAVSVAFTNAAETAIPEPSTWVMLTIGLAGLGYAAARRKDRTPLAF
jgi:opacity protein-like surface antigen